MRAFRGDTGRLDSPKRMPNGFMQADAYLTRVGVFPYQNKDGTIRRELRLPEEVFKADSLASFQMAPVTLGHPTTPVTAKNAKRYQVGHSGQDVRRDGDKMRGSIMVTDEDAVSAMEGGIRQISNGYFCDLEMTSGVTSGIDGVPDGLKYDCIQRNIVGNHIALVSRGRAGPDVHVRVDEMRFDGVDIEIDVATACEMRFDEDRDDAVWTTAAVNNLPDSAFLYVGPGGEKDSEGKTVPRSLRKFPVRGQSGSVDLPHLRNALARIPQSDLPAAVKQRLTSKAQRLLEAQRGDAIEPEHTNPLSEGQREKMDGVSAMEEFNLEINGVTFKFKGDSAARQALVKKIEDDESAMTGLQAKVDSANEKTEQEKARADAAEEAKAAAEAERDAAKDPAKLRERIDARLDLERTAQDVLGDEFDATKTDAELRAAVVVKVQPSAKLDGQSDAYVNARFDAAVEMFEEAKEADKNTPKHTRTRVAAHRADGGEKLNRVDEARKSARERNANAYKQPLAMTKDTAVN